MHRNGAQRVGLVGGGLDLDLGLRLAYHMLPLCPMFEV